MKLSKIKKKKLPLKYLTRSVHFLPLFSICTYRTSGSVFQYVLIALQDAIDMYLLSLEHYKHTHTIVSWPRQWLLCRSVGDGCNRGGSGSDGDGDGDMMMMMTAKYQIVYGKTTLSEKQPWKISQIARFMRPTWGPSGADRTQVGPMLAPWTLLSRILMKIHLLGINLVLG